MGDFLGTYFTGDFGERSFGFDGDSVLGAVYLGEIIFLGVNSPFGEIAILGEIIFFGEILGDAVTFFYNSFFSIITGLLI